MHAWSRSLICVASFFCSCPSERQRAACVFVFILNVHFVCQFMCVACALCDIDLTFRSLSLSLPRQNRSCTTIWKEEWEKEDLTKCMMMVYDQFPLIFGFACVCAAFQTILFVFSFVPSPNRYYDDCQSHLAGFGFATTFIDIECKPSAI